MQKLLNLLSGLFLIVVFVLSIIFSYFNSTPIGITFGAWEVAPLPVYVWIVGAFVSGGTLGLLLGLRFFTGIIAKNEVRRLKKQLLQTKEEVQKMRSLSIKDSH